MESGILKFICANQGVVNTDDLVYNLFPGDANSVSEAIGNPDLFVHCCSHGQPKVVARTSVRLCWDRGCVGTCGGLHLCKKFLLSGLCPFSSTSVGKKRCLVSCDFVDDVVVVEFSSGSFRGCVFNHDLTSDLNAAILREHKLESLNRMELCTLLLQSNNALLPPICFDYNNGSGEFGGCQDDCKRLHICLRYLKHDCSCSRNHDFNASQPLKVLLARGMPENLISSMKTVYQNKEAIRIGSLSGNHGKRSSEAAAAANITEAGKGHRGRGGHLGNRGNRGCKGKIGKLGKTYGGGEGNLNPKRAQSISDLPPTIDGSDRLQKSRSTNDLASSEGDIKATNEDGPTTRPRKRSEREKTEICLFFIKGGCKHSDAKCYKVHDKMPYRWEVREDGQWTALPENEKIEKDYCDPENIYSGTSPPVNFDTMTCGPNTVRRLSTSNCLVETTFMYTTEWLWYWEDERGIWNAYASATGGHSASDIDSMKLEQKFLLNDKDVVEFRAGSQSYSLSFQDMIQTNKQYGTKRLVRRRPSFVSEADVLAKRVRRPLVRSSFCPVPEHWDKTQIPAMGYQRVSLEQSSDEYKKIAAMFCKTMSGFDIVKIERIQNKALWEVFQWQKSQMRTKNGGRYVAEKKLFHGTDPKHIDAICHHNFDWRLCGTHGTAFGKGSYFAQDAKYSHSYTGDSDVKSLFISQVLVGDFTKGSPDYCRPPAKDGGDVNFYDSCVNDVINPSIYVVFEKHQIYPEYLLQYKACNTSFFQPSISVQSYIPPYHPFASVPSTTASYKPSTSVKTTTPSYQPSTSVQTTTASYHHFASVPSTTASYKPSTSVKTTTASYQPSTSVQTTTASYHPFASVPSTTASYKPSTSVKTTTASYQPSTSVQTTTASYHPFASVPSTTASYKPSTSVPSTTASYHPLASVPSNTASSQPSTLQYQPSTGTFHYNSNTTMKPPSPSPTSPKKNSDSCAIA